MAVAVLAALGVFAARALGRRSEARRRAAEIAERPGLSPEHPLRIRDFNEMDDAVDEMRCPCGGLLERIGEGSRPGMRVVRCVCVVCEEDVDLFFDLSQLRH
jgi:hypothetical protein